ncbi:vitelline membrane outer layer protein 1-like isoform X2 [Sinocyclocheilus rhinocerous]|uniref:vitelline membrane outer layer protein 1-like isoform X1 n=1 Tax=Sinocyclocheilus rhinocerous TaxID=307959 RepID=UPI0007BA6F1A|nr:PREDICTED: vitelline membrane outer layer protein 1-like isoform X1 [Sinocyclocheilus rhinocerous]XP_016423554.1 PREDICTED: vitelline membrane outer layer protein 1-like isoform X2 [Sinocyclocheilus rhinocerous]
MHRFISIMFSLLAFIGLHVSVQTAGRRSERSIERHFVSLLMVRNGMNWGSWAQREFCPRGTYAAGFSLMVEELSFGPWDNTALNGIRLHCISLFKDPHSDEHDSFIQSEVGSWGQWTKIKWCPSGFLTAFQLRVESSRGIGDDTAANNIRFNCSGESLLLGDGTHRGEWGDWSPLCQGRGMCGIMTRIEEKLKFGDDTALNDARMFCCD